MFVTSYLTSLTAEGFFFSLVCLVISIDNCAQLIGCRIVIFIFVFITHDSSTVELKRVCLSTCVPRNLISIEVTSFRV
jgi:hypothetical protein